MTEFTRRSFLLKSGGAMGAIGAAGMLPGWFGSTYAQTPATVKLAWGGSAEREAIIKSALEVIGQKLPHITIETETGSGSQFSTKIAAQLAAGAGPDIYITSILSLANLADSGVAQDLTEFIPNPIDMSTWSNQAVVGAQHQGKQYAISTGFNTFISLYDKALTEKAGVATIEPGWTWDNLADFAGEISAANKDAGIFGCSDASSDFQMFQVYIRSYGGEVFDADGRFLPTADDIVGYWDYWTKLRNAGACVTPDIQSRYSSTSDIAERGIVIGKAAIDFDFSNRFVQIENLANKPLMSTTLPQGERPGMFLRPSLMWMVSTGADDTAAAAAVVAALANDPEVGLLLNGNLGAPDNPEIFKAVSAAADPAQQRIYDYLDMVQTGGHVTELQNVVYPTGGSVLNSEFGPQAELQAFGQSSPADAAASFLGIVAQSLGQ